MADFHEKEGTITARCPGCNGAISSFLWRAKTSEGEIGAITKSITERHTSYSLLTYRLFRCSGCGMGGLGAIKYGGDAAYPGRYNRLIWFYPEVKERVPLPKATPKGITNEFQEAEMCYENDCYRAAAGLFRSVLDKTMRANGYKTNHERNLVDQIDAAAKDGVITESRRKRAHEEIRVLGNDVLHDDWCEIDEEDVELARHYCQRILEDFYDDRESVLKLLRGVKRVPEEDRLPKENPRIPTAPS